VDVYTVRIATVEDIAGMHRVRLSVRENQLSDPSKVQPHHYQEMLTTRGRGWIAAVDDVIRGFAVADLQEQSVWALFVHPRFEGRGLGRQLQQTMLEWTFGAGARQLSLTTAADTRAERFYTASGWRVLDRRHGGDALFEMTRHSWLSRTGRNAE
jgi:GNAT superfamily N-acetyltransferase